MTKKTLQKKIIFLLLFLTSCYIFKTGEYESYYKNGQVKHTGFYNSGKKDGVSDYLQKKVY